MELGQREKLVRAIEHVDRVLDVHFLALPAANDIEPHLRGRLAIVHIVIALQTLFEVLSATDQHTRAPFHYTVELKKDWHNAENDQTLLISFELVVFLQFVDQLRDLSSLLSLVIVTVVSII